MPVVEQCECAHTKIEIVKIKCIKSHGFEAKSNVLIINFRVHERN